MEADAFAQALLKNAGGDPLAGERLLEELAQPTSTQSIAGSFFSTHPSFSDRLANLRAKRSA